MDKDKRIGWLRELKVGDRVIIREHFRKYYGFKVAKISPTGRITVENSVKHKLSYNSNGRLIGQSSFHSSRLEPFDKAEFDNVRIQNQKKKILKEIKELSDCLKSINLKQEDLTKLNVVKDSLNQIKEVE